MIVVGIGDAQKRYLGGLACAAALALLGGCGHAAHMRPTLSPSLAAAPDAATVVFVRPSSFAHGIVPVIATTQGRFIGESEPSSYFVAKLPPGDHVLFCWSEGTPALHATLAAGKTYFVEVAPKMGVWSARIQLLAIKPSRETWPKRDEWIAESQPLAADEAAGQAYLASRSDDYREVVAKAMESLSGYSKEEIDERTLSPDDGLATAGVAPASPPSPPPSAPMAAAPAAPASADPARSPPKGTPDSVFLKNGGRVRGVVMEDEPGGVSVKLLDGTTRKLRRVEVDHVEYGNP